MSEPSTSAIMLRRVEYGESDMIVTLFSLERGKMSVFAKGAKKSKKRFAGALELFNLLEVVVTQGKKKGLFMLQEADIKKPYECIRTNIKKTAYASYFTELITDWCEEFEKQSDLFRLISDTFDLLNDETYSEEVLSILFQVKFLSLCGISPNLLQCVSCQRGVDEINEKEIILDLERGGLICEKCKRSSFKRVYLSKGTIKRLQWIESRDMAKACRIRFTPMAVKEGLQFLESFVPYHLGKIPKSLKFIHRIRT